MSDVANVRIWEGADAYVADVGTIAPTGVSGSWPSGWEPLGLLSEDGATEAREQDVQDHYAWGGILVRTTRSKHKRSMKITCLEDTPAVFGLVNPGSTASSALGITTRTVKVPVSDRRAFGLEVRDGNITKRRIIPQGEVVDVAEVAFADSQMTGYELTINIYPDADGVLYTDITDDPQAVES